MQVQTQLFCTGANYCDFIVHTKESIHIERIQPDNSFWEENVRKAKKFFEISRNVLHGVYIGLCQLFKLASGNQYAPLLHSVHNSFLPEQGQQLDTPTNDPRGPFTRGL